MIFRDGEGVTRNYVTVFSWAQKSAQQGDAVGQAVLGQLYKEGLGTPSNAQLSQYWQSKAQAQIAAHQVRQQQPPAAHQNTTETAQATQNNGQHQLTQSEAEGMAIILMMLAGSDGGDPSASASDPSDQAYEARRQQSRNEEDREREKRNQCEMRGGTVSSGIFSGSSCQ